jgi:hypothetical protein
MAIPAIAWTIISMLIKWASPVARQALEGGIKTYYKSALESPNVVDDVVAKILVGILSVDVSGVAIEPKPDTNTVPIPPEVVNLLVDSTVIVATGKAGWDQGLGGA